MNVFEYALAGAFQDFGGMVYNVRHPSAGAVGDGETDDRAALVAADTAAGGEGILAFPPGSYLVGSDWSPRTPLWLAPGAVLRITDPAVVLTVDVPLLGAVRRPLFDVVDDGSVVLGADACDAVLPEWWGPRTGSDQSLIRRAALAGWGARLPVDLGSATWGLTADVEWADLPSGALTVRGAGPGACRVRRADGTVRSDWQAMFEVQVAEGAEVTVEFSGMTLDANARGNPLPPGAEAFALEHCGAIVVVANGHRSVPEARFSDLVVLDPVADGIGILGSGGGSVGDVFVERVRAQGRSRARADVTITSGFDAVHLSDVSVDRLEVETNRVDPDLLQALHLCNVVVRDRLDLVCEGASAADVPAPLRAQNLTVRGTMALGEFDGRLEGFDIALERPCRLYRGRWTFAGGRLHAAAGFAGGAGLIYQADATRPEAVRFEDVRFTADPGAAVEYLYWRQTAAGTGERVELVRCVNETADASLVLVREGTTRIEACHHHGDGPMVRVQTAGAGRLELTGNRCHGEGHALALVPPSSGTTEIWMRDNLHTAHPERLLRCAEMSRFAPPHGGSTFWRVRALDTAWMDGPPDAGDWLEGHVVRALAPGPGDPPGWVCVAKGSPGRWEPLPAT